MNRRAGGTADPRRARELFLGTTPPSVLRETALADSPDGKEAPVHNPFPLAALAALAGLLASGPRSWALVGTESIGPAQSTVTDPTPTATATPEPLNHFLCYESQQEPIDRPGVALVDQFDPPSTASTVTVRRAKRLCAPANTNGEDPTAPNDLAHLTSYTIRQTSPSSVRPWLYLGVVPDDTSLARLRVKLGRADRLLVPASTNVGTQVPPALAAPIDHYKCYRVKGARTRVSGMTVETQFEGGPVTVAIKRPLDFCTPADENDEGIVDPNRYLMCYQVRAVPQAPRTVSTNNPFEQKTFDIFGIRELCVPAFRFPGVCNDGIINNAGEECDPPGRGDACASGICSPTCTCEPARCGDGLINLPGEECDRGDDDQCPGLCQADCTCPLAPPVCSGPVSSERCTCTSGLQFCEASCAGGLTCGDVRQGCVDFCNANGGGPGNCAVAACFDCANDQPCAE